MKARALLYGCPCFSEKRPASLLRATVADGPQPPLEDRTYGFKGPFLNLSDSLLICTSLLLLMPSVASFSGGHAVGGRMGVEDSKKVLLLLLSQKSCALMSNLAPSSYWCCDDGSSPLRGCSAGSTSTFGHTLVSSWAKISLMPLCSRIGIAPFGQLRA